MKPLSPLLYYRDRIKIVDQRKLPTVLSYTTCRTEKDVFSAIQKMKIRGAPAIGIAGAFGLYLGMRRIQTHDKGLFLNKLHSISFYLSTARPTAVNLSWALDTLKEKVLSQEERTIFGLKELLYREAVLIMRDDQRRSQRMGRLGARLIHNGDTCLTICNAGGMATSGYGTALSVFFKAHEAKKRFTVIACETRPLLQGARITTWELTQAKIPVTLICDSMAASIMKQKKIQKIFVGADRITRSGDFANKIGTYNLAVLAAFHHIPFYVVAPCSTFDRKLQKGSDIPVEYRRADEVTRLCFKKSIAPPGVRVLNPAFDVTDAKFVTAFITEKGIIHPPFQRSIAQIL